MVKAQYVIAAGRKTAMYTLRELQTVPSRFGGETDIYVYVCNLARDRKRALAKAEQVTGFLNIPFVVDELNDRAKSVSSEDKAAKQQRAEQERLEFLRRQEDEELELVAQGIQPFGTYSGTRFEDMPRDRLTWMVKEADKPESADNRVLQSVAEYIRANLPELLLPEIKGGYVGEPKQRLTFEATVIRSGTFMSYDFMGRPIGMTVTTMVDAEGHALVVISSSWSASVGQTIKFKGTVKAHDEYKGVQQTVLQRVKTL